MRVATTPILLAAVAFSASAATEHYQCAYKWDGKTETHSIRLDVFDQELVVDSGLLSNHYLILERSDQEVIAAETFTKQKAGQSYPIGVDTFILHKASGEMVRSNTFVDCSFNNHGYGQCERRETPEVRN